MYSGDGGDPTMVLRHYALFCIIIVFFLTQLLHGSAQLGDILYLSSL